MQSTTGLISILALGLALVGTVTFGANQEAGGTKPPAATATLSGTRTASCLIKVTADPGIIPLNGETFVHLLYSSSVTGRAAQDVLGISFSDTRRPQDILKIDVARWDASRARGLTVTPATPETLESSGFEEEMMQEYEEQMTQEMENIYGQEYSGQVLLSEAVTPEKKDEVEEKRKASPSRSNRRSRWDPGVDTDGDRTRGRSVDRFRNGGVYGGMFGGMGTGGMYDDQTTVRLAPRVEQSLMLKFSVRLPEDIKPAAQEFAMTVVQNLRQSLWQAYEQHMRELEALVEFAESRRDDAQEQFERAGTVPSPQKRAVEERLETIIDLSMLSPEMPFSEAIEILRKSVEPPLPIVVLWRDLEENAQILPTTAINMDGVPDIKLGTGLEVLLQAVAGGFVPLTYQVRDGVVVIGTVDTFEMAQEAATPVTVEVDARALYGRSRELTHQIQNLELDLAGWEARRKALQEQIARAEMESQRKLETDQVTQELERIVQAAADKLARAEEHYRKEIEPITAIEDAREQLARARIELARRREELGRSVGGGQLDEFSNELARMAVDTAEKRAQLDILRRQLEEVRHEAAKASTFDPQAARIRMAKELLDVAERRVVELRTRLANLQPPTVTMIGLE